MNLLLNNPEIYNKGDQAVWKGRIDGQDREWMRWHQLMDCVDLLEQPNLRQSIAFLGFCSDEGVARNQGRVGAKDGPTALRNVLTNLPVHFSDKLKLKDCGDILLKDNDLELSQQGLGAALNCILEQEGFPVILGGGHEVAYGHYLGVKEFLKSRNQSLGIINLDAHLDIRPLEDGKGNSGTGFFQIEQDQSKADLPFHYLAIGIQEISNTKGLLDYAKEKDVQIIERESLIIEKLDLIREKIVRFSKSVDYVYLTIDLDAFAAAYAPGVSALAFNGIVPDQLFFTIYDILLDLPNIRSVDFAELNPYFDIDSRTAKLAADLIFKLTNKIATKID
ncbi:formimidoylglutamase [Sphingobacterium sp. Lzh-3]|uniref:formimidoylglutamase n=1 Tax=unclassified Sphingobacterium TaxID=2609468 RepID=UPI0029545D6C|nr:formimidoylglutamase [Sphingobacterium sp. UGAL515B_05]WON93468.1 formimidoylglutamase [Sphingobacterium sp. UGAL515B_05]